MPSFKVEAAARIVFYVVAESAEKAADHVEAIVDDYYMQIPCGGHQVMFGLLGGTVWADDARPTATEAQPVGKFNPLQEDD